MTEPRRAARRRITTALCLAAVALGAAWGAAPKWSYTGANGPDRWGAIDSDFATCAVGRQQSPLDLTAAAPRDLVNPQPAYVPSAARIVDDGHTVQVDLQPGSFLTVDGVPYALVQFHFHSPSEHTIDGSSFPVELHLVHRAESGALAVLGILVAGGATNPALAPLLATMPSKVGKDVRLPEAFDPTPLLPSDLRGYRYPGSLTTPPCTEGVTWIVLATPIQAAGSQIAAFARVLQGNNRPAQPRGERELVLDSSP